MKYAARHNFYSSKVWKNITIDLVQTIHNHYPWFIHYGDGMSCVLWVQTWLHVPCYKKSPLHHTSRLKTLIFLPGCTIYYCSLDCGIHILLSFGGVNIWFVICSYLWSDPCFDWQFSGVHVCLVSFQVFRAISGHVEYSPSNTYQLCTRLAFKAVKSAGSFII